MNLIKNYFLIILVSFLVIFSGFFIYKKLNPEKLPSYLIESVGFVDGDLIHINAKYAGRIISQNFKEGDFVKKGDVVSELDYKEYSIKKEALLKQIDTKKVELELTQKLIPNQIKQTKQLLNIKIKTLQSLDYDIKTLKAVISQNEVDLQRVQNLVDKKLDKKHDLELKNLELTKNRNSLLSLLKKRAILENDIEIAKLNLQQAKDSYLKIDILKKAILSMQKEVESVEEMINQMKLISPVNGFVEKRISLVGEVVGNGMPVINIVDNSSFYLKVYIDELKNGQVKLNQKASIFLDNELRSAIDAKVVYISNKAEFTPKDVAVREDRITRVYEVWLKPVEKNEYLKLGLPAIGMILIDDTKELPKTLKGLPLL